MGFWSKIAVFILSIGLCNGQSMDLLGHFLSTDNSNSIRNAHQKIENLMQKIESKEKKSDRQLLKNAFRITHREILKNYQQYASFGDLFEHGQYDCLTATSLYSILLTKLGFDHQIIETTYHIFILVNVEDGVVLMESTDPIEGFEYQPDRVNQRLASYESDGQVSFTSTEQHFPNQKIYNTVNQQELIGLLYYNQSVKAFNNQQWMEADQLLQQAKKFYYSSRIVELENLLVGISVSAALEKSLISNTQKNIGKIISQNP